MYKNSEIMELTGFSSSMLWKFRNGHKYKKYYYDKILYEGVHYIWFKGEVIYTQKGLNLLMNYKDKI